MDVVLVFAQVAFVVSALAVCLLRPLARASGLVDRPGGRKTHVGEVPIAGGMAMFLGVAAAAASAHLGADSAVIIVLAGVLVLVGTLDDRFDLPPLIRLCIHLLVAVVLTLGTGFAVRDFGNLFGWGVIHLWPFGGIFTIVAAVALMNGFNMVDGMDGLAGSVAFWGFLGLAIIAVTAGVQSSAIIACSMVGVVSAFLVFNIPVRWNRGLHVFMGDAGSTFLGLVFAGIALTLVQTGRGDIPPALLLWLVPIPIFELFSSFCRRLFRGLCPMDADDGHYHHQLQRKGLSAGAVFILYFIVSALSVGIGVLGHLKHAPEPEMFLGFLGFYALWVLGVGAPAWLKRWMHQASRGIHAGAGH